MKPFVQDKNQVTLPDPGDGSHTMVNPKFRHEAQTELEMPPGGSISPERFASGPAGSTDPSGVGNVVTGINRPTRPPDFLEGETETPFYREAGGFVERNNMLDRSE